MNRTALSFAISLAAASSVQASTVQLITNGGFETGTFAGWTVTDLAGSSGTFSVTGALVAPISGNATVGPASGSFYAVSDQTGPGTHALEQVFTVPGAATAVILQFDMFMNDWSGAGPIVNPAGLDHNAFPNQHARVDIMTAVAGSFSTLVADIVANVVAPGVDGGTDPNPYTTYSFDLTGLVAPGGTYKLRFAEVDNQFFFNQGVDNVSINARIPEPGSLALLGLGLLGVWARRRQQ